MSLDEFCLSIVVNSKARNLYFADFLLLLYNTGIRFNERNKTLWSIKDVMSYNLKALKRNELRTVSKSLLPISFLEYLNGAIIPAYEISFSTFNRQLLYLFPSMPIYQGEKLILSHIFRHNFAKKLKIEGYSDIMIQKVMAEKMLSSAQHYIYSEIIIN